MKKHIFLPNDRSYFNGTESIDTYKCEFCGTVVHNSVKITGLDKRNAECSESVVYSTFKEDFKDSFDCTVQNDTIKYKFDAFKLCVSRFLALLPL